MTGPRQANARMFALYNRWANDRLFAAAALLPPAALAENRGAFFGSLRGTLNHLLIVDRLWRSRLQGISPGPTQLDAIPYPELADLAAARAAENAALIAHVFALSEDDLAAPLDYATTSGAPQSQPLHHALAHIFNHQTHHRGQAHDLLSQLAGPNAAPSLDLLVYQRFVMPQDTP